MDFDEQNFGLEEYEGLTILEGRPDGRDMRVLVTQEEDFDRSDLVKSISVSFRDFGLPTRREYFDLGPEVDGRFGLNFRYFGEEDPWKLVNPDDSFYRMDCDMDLCRREVSRVDLNVHGDFKGQGIGSRIVFAYEEFWKKIGLERVRLGGVKNTSEALSFWSSLGYSIEGLVGFKEL